MLFIARADSSLSAPRNPDLPTEVDGDPGPAMPAQITVVPNAVRLMVLEGAKPAGIRRHIMRVFR